MNAGIIGGIAGSVIGLLGGAFGTWMGIRKTNSPRERAFMIKASVVVWIAVAAFLGLLMLLPRPWNQVMWIFYGILLPLGIRTINHGQQLIRAEEANHPETRQG